MSNESTKTEMPFVEFTVTCPMCQKDGGHRMLKEDAYRVLKYDVDLYPISCEWKNPAYRKLIPSAFYMRQCPYCLYTANHEYYENPALDLACSNNHFKKRFHINNESDEVLKSIVEILSARVEGESSYFTAVKKFLLAIRYLQTMNSVEKQDSLPLAYYCLQLSYFYRDLEMDENWMVIKHSNDELRYDLCNIWKEAPTAASMAFDLSLHYFQQAYEKSSILSRNDIEPQILQMMGRMLVALERYEEARHYLLKTVSIGRHMQWDKSCKNIPNYDEFMHHTQELLAKIKSEMAEAEEKDSDEGKSPFDFSL